MRTKKYLAVISLFLTVSLQAQQAQNIYGFVFDASSKEILIGAVVFDSVSGRGTVSNEFGYYNLMLSGNEPIYIQVSYIGYKKQSFLIRHADSSRHDIYMFPGIELGEVKVTADRIPDITRTTETSTIRLPMREVKMLPNLFGEVDIVKAYQLTPGVQSGGEGKSELYVRGGSPDQNLIILDDVPLYYVSHFGGFFSVFNADAINDVKLIKGGFPARYGGRLSSVMDVRMKDGNMNKTTGAGSIGLLSTKLMVEGPLLKDKSSFMVSARKNLLSPFNLANTNLKYNFYDLNAKLNYRLTKKDRLFFSFYAGNDIVQVANDLPQNYAATGVKWGNLALALRYNRVFSEKIFGNLILASTQYRYINRFENKIVSDTITQLLNSELHTRINDLMLKGDFSWQVSSSYLLRFGFTGIHHSITPNDEVFDKSIGDRTVSRAYNFTSTAYENSLYAENEISIPFGGLNVGFRYVHFLFEQQTYHFIEPRFNLNIPLQADLSVKVSYAITNQFLHLLSYSGAGMPADYWMPSTANIKPSQAKQLTAGVAKTFNDGLFQLSIEAYHKRLDGLIAFKPGSSLIGNLSSWENVVVSGGKGLNYGIEFFLQKVQGRSTGWAGFTMARAERQFALLNKGKTFPFKYDRLLDISLVWNFKINPKVNISATWTYGSGYPVTLATERYNTEDGEVFVYDDINSFRMRDFHRLDFAINFPKKTKWGVRAWSLSIFNLYNRKNPFYYYYQREMVDNSPVSGSAPKEGELKLYQRSLFGIFPSISYNFKF
jgi:hypothetical protein